jgi:hypothetical protein
MTCVFCERQDADQNAVPFAIYRRGVQVYTCRRASCMVKAFKLPRQQTALQRRSARLQKTYNLTHNDYLTMLAEQDGGCAICHTPPPRGQHLAVDHDHSTGYVRGLLCTRCNLQLGWYENNRQSVTRYLRKYKIVPVR